MDLLTIMLSSPLANAGGAVGAGLAAIKQVLVLARLVRGL